METLAVRVGELCNKNILLLVLVLFFFHTNETACQEDSTRLFQLIKETHDIFIYPFAQGVYFSPYEIREHHRDQKIKNIEMVDSIVFYRVTGSQEKRIPFFIKNNQTIIQKPEDSNNSYTFIYYKDGRIDRTLRGRHLNDLYLSDEDGFLIQHGYGGELKRAQRKGKTFEWFNVKRNKLEYITAYDDQNRLTSIKTMGHYFGPAVDYEIEEYAWSGNQLTTTNTIRKYKENGTDSTFTQFTYDSLGLITAVKSRTDEEHIWSSTQFATEVEYQNNEQIKMTIAHKEKIVFSITFDHYDNWIEMVKYNATLRREIKYRKKRRRS